MSDKLYQDAQLYRVMAEERRDPGMYRKAALLFLTLGMNASAERCIDRARHYEQGDIEHGEQERSLSGQR